MRSAYDREHDRELEKHEWRPGDNPRTSTTIDAIEIAVLVKGMKNIPEAAKLIDQYAQSVASAAKLEEAQHIYDRLDRCTVKP